MRKIKKGDTVQIILGKDRGRSGKVLRVFGKKRQVLVEGLNIVKRHVKKMGGREGGILEISKPLDISNVMLICPVCQKPTRVGVVIKEQKKIRICKRCQKEID